MRACKCGSGRNLARIWKRWVWKSSTFAGRKSDHLSNREFYAIEDWHIVHRNIVGAGGCSDFGANARFAAEVRGYRLSSAQPAAAAAGGWTPVHHPGQTGTV